MSISAAGDEGQVVTFDADATAPADERCNRAPVIVPFPIGVDDVVAMPTPPWLAAVDIGAEGGAGIMVHDKAIGAAEAAIQDARIIRDVVHGREKDSVEVMLCHDGAQASYAIFVFGLCKGQSGFCAIVAGKGLRAVCRIEHGFSLRW